MSYPMITIVNSETGESINREMNDVEYAHHLNILEQQKKEQERLIAKATAEAKLAALGLTPDDLKALGL